MIDFRKFALAAYMSTAAIAGGAWPLSAALASESPVVKRGACHVAAAADGSQPKPLSDEAIRTRLIAGGFTQVRSIEREDGCVEAKGLDKDGKRFEVYLHPTTGEIVGRR